METKENLKERLKHQVMERMDISRTMEDEEILDWCKRLWKKTAIECL